MSPLRERMIEDMTLGSGDVTGLPPQSVRRLAARYRRSPDQLSEEEVHGDLLELRRQGSARGTFKATCRQPRGDANDDVAHAAMSRRIWQRRLCSRQYTAPGCATGAAQ